MIQYTATKASEHDGVTTRWTPVVTLETDADVVAELERMSEQRQLLWETLATIRSHRYDLDRVTLRQLVNYAVLLIFHGVVEPRFREDLAKAGFDMDRFFYDEVCEGDSNAHCGCKRCQ